MNKQRHPILWTSQVDPEIRRSWFNLRTAAFFFTLTVLVPISAVYLHDALGCSCLPNLVTEAERYDYVDLFFAIAAFATISYYVLMGSIVHYLSKKKRRKED